MHSTIADFLSGGALHSRLEELGVEAPRPKGPISAAATVALVLLSITSVFTPGELELRLVP